MAAAVSNNEQLLAEAVKATQAKGVLYWDRHTPENSPEPEIQELPKEDDKDDVKRERLTKIIDHIQNEDENPYNILEVKNSEEFANRTPRLLKSLEQAEVEKMEGAAGALEKARKAEAVLAAYFAKCQEEVKRVLDEKDSSALVILDRHSDDETPEDKYELLRVFVNPDRFKGEGAVEARKVLDQAMEDAKKEDVEMTEGTRPEPDAETLALYEKASPVILELLRTQNFTDDATKPLDEINDEIEIHNSTHIDEKGVEMLRIPIGELSVFSTRAVPLFTKLAENPSRADARKALEYLNEELRKYLLKNYYPTSWQFPMPGSLDEMLARVPTSTKMEIECESGATPDGGIIHRYNEFFVKRDEKNNVVSARYNFLVETDGRYYIKTGKDIGEAATNAYVAEGNDKKVKMGTYYGEEKYGIKYTKQYFNTLRKLEKKDGAPYLYFLGAARRSDSTKSGRIMPAEYCVIGIRDPDLKTGWYDVFKRSTFVNLYGNDMARRIDNYWKDLGQKPSFRKPLEGEGKPAAAPAATNPDIRTTRSSNPSNEATQSLRNDLDKLRDEVSSIKAATDRVLSFEEKMAELMTKMGELTTSINEMKQK